MAVRTMGSFQVDVGHNLILIYKIITWANTLKNGLCDAREDKVTGGFHDQHSRMPIKMESRRLRLHVESRVNKNTEKKDLWVMKG